MKIFSVRINYFHQFFDFLTFPCYKETNDVDKEQMKLALFCFQPTLNRLFKNYIKLYWYLISSSWDINGGNKLTSSTPHPPLLLSHHTSPSRLLVLSRSNLHQKLPNYLGTTPEIGMTFKWTPDIKSLSKEEHLW